MGTYAMLPKTAPRAAPRAKPSMLRVGPPRRGEIGIAFPIRGRPLMISMRATDAMQLLTELQRTDDYRPAAAGKILQSFVKDWQARMPSDSEGVAFAMVMLDRAMHRGAFRNQSTLDGQGDPIMISLAPSGEVRVS